MSLTCWRTRNGCVAPPFHITKSGAGFAENKKKFTLVDCANVSSSPIELFLLSEVLLFQVDFLCGKQISVTRRSLEAANPMRCALLWNLYPTWFSICTCSETIFLGVSNLNSEGKERTKPGTRFSQVIKRNLFFQSLGEELFLAIVATRRLQIKNVCWHGWINQTTKWGYSSLQTENEKQSFHLKSGL